MSFDFYQFAKTNKKVIIWVSFFGFLFLVREVFGLVFLTFIMCYIFNNAIEQLERRTPLGRHFWTIVFYLFFAAVFAALFSFGLPRVAAEANHFFTKLPESIDAFHAYIDRLAVNKPQLAPFLNNIKESISIKNMLGIKREALVEFVVTFFQQISHFLTYFLLATLFSFLILLDFPNLRQRVRELRDTRFQDVYEETADSVARFSLVVGFTFQAQILIAVINTLLTTLGLWILKIDPIVLLAMIVFFAGLIPVWGTFISSGPILLLAVNDGGIELVLKALFMIVLVHVIEAYILNPRIVSAVLKINPLVTLIILYVGHSLFGIWGVLLGVPTAVYVYRYIVMKPAAKEA